MSHSSLSSTRLGVLSVRLLYARGLKDGDLFGQQDPYVKVHVGTQVLRSRVVRGGGVNPTFNQTLLFHVTDRTMTLVLELLDEDLFTDDHLGVATTDLTELIAAGLPPPPPPVAGDDKQLKQPEAAQQQKQPEPQQLTLPVRSRKSGKQHGTITLELTFWPRGTEPPGAPQRASSLPEPSKLPSAPPAVGYPAGAVATGTPAAAAAARRGAPAGYPSSSPAAPQRYSAQQGRYAYGQAHPQQQQQQVVYVQQPYRGRYGGYGGYGGYCGYGGYGYGGVGLGGFGGLLGGLLLANLAFGF